MVEQFVTVALEAFTNANGDVDKFELQLRRKLMTVSTPLVAQTPREYAVQTQKVDSVISSLENDDPIFKELENIDVNNLSDEEIIDLAKKMGFLSNQSQENE